ncbi:N-acetylaspartylglutamate synthase A [Spea bombifrons]|uniref:N-acetylaspartylglutamate synthase A n=1 Tax=Spea bombifrons TaxID=233779 RepID=UPI00234989B8|nr:N-acetylaspartylglutamate synthase A [Spea bombifrons]
MGSQLWLLTDRQILEDYPQTRISEALKLRCREQEVGFALVLMEHIALTVTDGHLGLQINQKIVTAYPQVILVRLPTPTVQSDSAITVLRHLEKLGCRLVNHPKAILNCVNKFWTFQELAGHGIPLPDTFSYGGHDDFSKMIQAAEPLGYPVVVKNTRGYQGRAVFLARDKHHLLDLSHLMRHDAPYLFQKYVKDSHGKGVRAVIVGGRLIGSILCCSTDDRMQSSCCLGGTAVSCALSEQGKLLASRVSSILGADVCAIDLLLQDNGSFVVCDADANVSFAEFDQAWKLDLGSVIADYALSLLPGKIRQETPPLSAAPGAEETQETPGQEPSASCSRIEDIKDCPNVPKPRPPAPSDCTHNTDK